MGKTLPRISKANAAIGVKLLAHFSHTSHDDSLVDSHVSVDCPYVDDKKRERAKTYESALARKKDLYAILNKTTGMMNVNLTKSKNQKNMLHFNLSYVPAMISLTKV